MKFYYSQQKLKYDNSCQIATGIIPKLNLVWFQWQWMAMNFVSICYEYYYFSFCSVWTTISQSSCEPCEHFAQNASNLWKTYVQGCTVVKLLQPYCNLVIFIWGYILYRQNWYTIHQHCLHGTWRAHQKHSLFYSQTICNAIICEVNQNTSLFFGLLAIWAVNQFYGYLVSKLWSSSFYVKITII